ncbi:MAG: hypothetical protein EOP04_00235 [Proteobacteria bacterium]|nr:MAG: hypothetical protein EOP04_00235 [Pseudomonadota bacterium]
MKEITAGALYNRPESSSDTSMLAYEIYFRHEVLQTGAERTLIDIEEVKRIDKKIKESISFVPAKAIAFVLPRKADVFRFAAKLRTAGVNVIEAEKFHKPVTGAQTFSKASSYGILREISDVDFQAGNYSDRDILIFNDIIRYWPGFRYRHH